MEFVRYAESECQALFNANESVSLSLHEHCTDEIQILSLSNICMVDGSWTSTSQFSGCGWTRMHSLGKIQLMETHNLKTATCYFAYIIRSTEMSMETCFNIPHGQSFETNCKYLIATINEP